MDIDELRCIGNVEIIYPSRNKKFVMKTYIANKVNGNPLDLDDNYSYWLPISELTNNEKKTYYALMSYILIRYTGKARLYGLFSLGVWRCLKYLNLYSPRFFYAVK